MNENDDENFSLFFLLGIMTHIHLFIHLFIHSFIDLSPLENGILLNELFIVGGGTF